MSQSLITAPCPNCGTDANNHNKVLYDGIFLICHYCGYGWYYNIEVFNPKKTNNYNPNTSPLNTLQSLETHSYNKHSYKPQSQRKIKASKQNRVPSNHNTSSTLLHKSHYSNSSHNTKQTEVSNYNKNTANVKETSNYTSNNSYSDNFYYEQPQTHHSFTAAPKSTQSVDKPNTFKQTTSPISTNKPLDFNKEAFTTNKPSLNITSNANHAAAPNSANINYRPSTANYLKEQTKANNSTAHKAHITTNRVKQQIIITPKDINTKDNNITINLNNLPNNVSNKTLKNNEPIPINNKRTIEKNIHNNVADTTKLPESIRKTLPKTNNIADNKDTLTIKSKVNNSGDLNTKISNDSDNNTAEIKPKPTATLVNDLMLHSHKPKESTVNHNAYTKEEPAYNNSNNANLESFKDQLHFNNSDNSATLNKPISTQATNNFNLSLKQKENLGLDPTSLLKIEEQDHYNIKQYGKPLLESKSLMPDIKDLGIQLKQGLIALLQATTTLATRPDLLLRALAYAVILGSAIAFLVYNSYTNKKTTKQSELENSAYNNNYATETVKNLKDKDNLSLSGVRPLEEPPSDHSLGNNSVTLTKDKDEDKVIAFQKQHGENLPQQTTNDKLPNNLSKNNNTPSLINTVQAKIKSGLLSLKQLQQNSFSKVKIYNTSTYWQGTHNDTFIANTTLANEDSSNSYLIKSLEVVFLDNNGETLGKRIIVANQLLNNNSAINLSLKINNPPINTNKTFVFIKDKSKL